MNAKYAFSAALIAATAFSLTACQEDPADEIINDGISTASMEPAASNEIVTANLVQLDFCIQRTDGIVGHTTTTMASGLNGPIITANTTKSEATNNKFKNYGKQGMATFEIDDEGRTISCANYTMTYDADGQMTLFNGNTYTWAEGNCTAVTAQDGSQVEFTYAYYSPANIGNIPALAIEGLFAENLPSGWEFLIGLPLGTAPALLPTQVTFRASNGTANTLDLAWTLNKNGYPVRVNTVMPDGRKAWVNLTWVVASDNIEPKVTTDF